MGYAIIAPLPRHAHGKKSQAVQESHNQRHFCVDACVILYNRDGYSRNAALSQCSLLIHCSARPPRCFAELGGPSANKLYIILQSFQSAAYCCGLLIPAQCFAVTQSRTCREDNLTVPREAPCTKNCSMHFSNSSFACFFRSGVLYADVSSCLTDALAVTDQYNACRSRLEAIHSYIAHPQQPPGALLRVVTAEATQGPWRSPCFIQWMDSHKQYVPVT